MEGNIGLESSDQKRSRKCNHVRANVQQITIRLGHGRPRTSASCRDISELPPRTHPSSPLDHPLRSLRKDRTAPTPDPAPAMPLLGVSKDDSNSMLRLLGFALPLAGNKEPPKADGLATLFAGAAKPGMLWQCARNASWSRGAQSATPEPPEFGIPALPNCNGATTPRDQEGHRQKAGRWRRHTHTSVHA